MEMIKVTMDVNGTTMTYDISTMETLAKFQAQLTEDFFRHYEQELSDDVKNRIVDDYLNAVDDDFSMRADFVERIENGMTNTFDDIIARALRDTNYDTIDEMTDAIEQRDSALYDICSITKDYI
jgi:hypothetical protein